MNKPISIFVFPTHCSKEKTPGVDYCRMILPMRELQKDPRFKVTIFDNTLSKKALSKFDWRDIAQEYDILYINYLTLPWDFAMIGMLFRKYGKKIVFDIDDLIWEIQKDNSSYEVYKPGSDGRAVITDIVNEVDYVTVTNNYLRNALISYTKKTYDKVAVMPNRIDLDLYKWKTKPKKKSRVRIGYFGSSSHFNDLGDKSFSSGLEKLMKEYPNVEVLTVGAMLASFKRKFGARYFNDFGHQDIYTWVGLMKDKLKEVDIWAVPLVTSTYNKSKSSIKFLEMSSTGRPGCWQKIRQYEEVVKHGKNGFLCSGVNSWYSNLKKLVDSPKLRRKMGREALKTVKNDWQMSDPKNIKLYVDLFQKVMS